MTMVRKYGRCPEGVEMKNLITCLTVCVLSGAVLADTIPMESDGHGRSNFPSITHLDLGESICSCESTNAQTCLCSSCLKHLETTINFLQAHSSEAWA